MADYTTQTFVDDDGSATTGTVLTKAIMDHIEAGIADAAAHHRIGLFASMPVAAAANKNWLWIATDTDGSGGLYLSDGSTWNKVLTPIDGQFGDGSDGSWTALTTPTNVMANSDMAASVNGWAGFFNGGGVGSGPTQVADVAFTGGHALEVAEAGATGAGVVLAYPGGTASFINGGAVNVVPGQVVEFSAQMKAQVGAMSQLRLTARWLKADGSLISEVDVTNTASPTVGTVFTLSGTLIAPANAAYAGVEVIGQWTTAGSYTLRASNITSRPLMPGTTRSGTTYTMTRDVYFTDLTVNSGVTIAANGYRIYCRGKLSGAGTISQNGVAGSGRTGGNAAPDGSIKGGWGGGGGGGNGAANGSAPGTAPGVGHGGAGSAGGAGTGGFTGAAGTTPTTPTGGIRRALPEVITGMVGAAQFGGGGAGGGGGGATGGTGGGGGGAGGLLIIVAHVIAGTVALQAKGGDGAGATVNGGGGGGGGGGAIHLLYADKSGWTGTATAAGGAAGAGNGTGAAGTAGSAGNVIQLAAA